MPPPDLALSDIRQRALALADEDVDDSHYGAAIDLWINDGLQELVRDSTNGIEDDKTFTTVPGQRAYDLPVGFIKNRLVLYDGLPIIQYPVINLDFFSTGDSDIDRYAIWGAGPAAILLGPLPPDQPTTLQLFFYREPMYLSSDGDRPEIPNRFRHMLAEYAFAQTLMADGSLQDYGALMARWEKGKTTYKEWLKYNRAQNYSQVQREWDS